MTQNWSKKEIAFLLYCLELYSHVARDQNYKKDFVSIYLTSRSSSKHSRLDGDPRDNLKAFILQAFSLNAKAELANVNPLKVLQIGVADRILSEKNLNNRDDIKKQYQAFLDENAECNENKQVSWKLEGSTSFDVTFGKLFISLWNHLN